MSPISFVRPKPPLQRLLIGLQHVLAVAEPRVEKCPVLLTRLVKVTDEVDEPLALKTGDALLNVTIEVDSENARIVTRIFELYASGDYSLSTLRKQIRMETGKTINRAYLHTILTNRFYLGTFEWRGNLYPGNHQTFTLHTESHST